MATKYIFFTGGVVSSVGKGVTAAAMGRLLERARVLRLRSKNWIPISTSTRAR